MRAPWWRPLVVLLASCGPEEGVTLRAGVYDVSNETATNDCSQTFLDTLTMDGVLFADDRLTISFPDFPSRSGLGSGWGSNTRVYPNLVRDPESGSFVPEPGHTFFNNWNEYRGCRLRRDITAELPADDVIRARVTYEWEDAGACEWLSGSQLGCKLVREYTYTLREACEDCTLDELFDRARALLLEEHPLPK